MLEILTDYHEWFRNSSLSSRKIGKQCSSRKMRQLSEGLCRKSLKRFYSPNDAKLCNQPDQSSCRGNCFL